MATATPKIYLIMRTDFDDLDSFECFPVAATTFEESGIMIADEKTVSHIRSSDFMGFDSYIGYHDIRNNKVNIVYSTLSKGITSIGLTQDLEFLRPIKTYSDKQLLKIVAFLGLKFFYVEEIDLLA